MKFSELTFITKVKLVAGNILMFGGVFTTLTSGSLQGLIMILAGNLIHLDGRISRLEEIDESNRKQANQDS